MTQVFTEEGVTYYQLAAIKQGLKACKIGMRVNRAYTPTNLRNTVEKVCGVKHKITDYDGMIATVEAKMIQLVEAARPPEAADDDTTRES